MIFKEVRPTKRRSRLPGQVVVGPSLSRPRATTGGDGEGRDVVAKRWAAGTKYQFVGTRDISTSAASPQPLRAQ